MSCAALVIRIDRKCVFFTTTLRYSRRRPGHERSGNDSGFLAPKEVSGRGETSEKSSDRRGWGHGRSGDGPSAVPSFRAVPFQRGTAIAFSHVMVLPRGQLEHCVQGPWCWCGGDGGEGGLFLGVMKASFLA
ncbi:hypothetical protein AAFF_G00256900 [Aldrovandia affinis]|uniref:Uncharacterized protein n=1 Tax=Aldrovandia affinis TaxID=143900 RepID=A0AAD7SUX8_9TELE|nr:hypothetical protein AAFF_G00256900 [Aldrovandia affinis]